MSAIVVKQFFGLTLTQFLLYFNRTVTTSFGSLQASWDIS